MITETEKNILIPSALRHGRPLTPVTQKQYKSVLGTLKPQLDDWKSAATLSRKTGIEYGVISTILKVAAHRGELEAIKTNPISYKLKSSSNYSRQPTSDDVTDDIHSKAINRLDDLRWLRSNLIVPSTISDLQQGSRASIDQISKYLLTGIALGYVSYTQSDNNILVYSIQEQIPEDLSRGRHQISMLKRRLSPHLETPTTALDLSKKLGITRERVRQILNLAINKGLVVKLEQAPFRYQLVDREIHTFDTINQEPGNIFKMPVEQLPLSGRTLNIIKEFGIDTIETLTSKSRDDLSKLPRFGKKSIDEIVIALANLGLGLGDNK